MIFEIEGSYSLGDPCVTRTAVGGVRIYSFDDFSFYVMPKNTYWVRTQPVNTQGEIWEEYMVNGYEYGFHLGERVA